MSLPILRLGGLVLAGALGVAGVHAVTGSAGGVSVAGPVCVTHTVQPGTTVTVNVNVVNGTGAAAKVDLSTDPNIGPPSGPPWPPGGHPIPRSWVGVSGPYSIAAQSTVPAPVTIHVPGGVPSGRYATSISGTSYGSPSGSGNQIGLAGGGTDFLQVSVGVSPPPRAYCDNQRDKYWPWVPPLPVCKRSQPPLQGRNVMCQVEGLVPPAVSAKNCGWSQWKWDRYIRQLELAGQRYDHNPKALLKDAWCRVGGHILNRAGFYSGYRVPDNGQTGPASNARTY